MSNHKEWPADNYAIGSYIQSTVADQYLSYLDLKPTDNVLDIGCGNGKYSQKILQKIPQGTLLGIDSSENMLKLAENVAERYSNFNLQKDDVNSMDFKETFDYVVSFWCLQWTSDIHQAFENIFLALKPEGKLLTLFPTGDDPFMTTYQEVKASGQFPELEHFHPPVDYSKLKNLENQIKDIPFTSLTVERHQESILLPSLDVFRKFVNGIGFYQGEIPAERIPLINEAMVKVFEKECQRKYAGEYQFAFSIYFIRGEK
ncbi:methyltransferase domain-containing protein [Legionella israelensis]|uniref:class I SAM-dependent methyltransferase n=1 Tax=Legionella israelensis TaxID=454 RepID=UPI0011812317|nr:class I SAM-dependent methyltransferase [Legionella israelensis]QDP71958.1 methyltransferase domain-containing protein [Legionella israelensis]